MIYIAKSHVPENSDITINNQENGNGMHSVISKQNGEHEISFEGDKSAPSFINNKTEITNVDEITEYDVETVLKKQDTHDLFCPNCNSCITKRVILRKRKRRIPAPGEDAKRNKPVSSALNAVLDDSSDNQALNGVDSRLDDVQQPISDEQDHQREADETGCLENEENNELSQKEVPVKKSWFSNFWGSEKVEHNVTDLNDSGTVQSLDAKNNIVGVSSVSSNLNSSMQEANSHTSDGTTDLAKNQLQSDNVIRESNGQKDGNRLYISRHSGAVTYLVRYRERAGSKREYPGMFVVKPPLINVEATENSISPLEHDGLKLLVPLNAGSLIIDTSQMKQELDVTVQTNNPGLDEKGRTNLSFSPPASKLGQLNLDGQVPINLAINGTEQKMDKYSVQSTDVMPQVSHKNVGIHLEEPLKVNKDVLTDKQINLLEDVNNIGRIKGKETIITIESKQLDASVIQRPVDTLGATALQQAVEREEVVAWTLLKSPQKSYFKTIGYYGFMISGVSYLFGGLIIKLLEKMDIFHEGSVENLRMSLKPALATVKI
ncbi:hypothetical protein L1987_09110 [Smallanthus sonchifolius]|uniref:Uncharacterized protein n=1 Tax=Smallanthus sonchifolius TaxID=185202 RepID=A0ACB9JMH3_9ASTR|nr:hypothetical protein L1987_09110 [Smallanthus sonchifolius]